MHLQFNATRIAICALVAIACLSGSGYWGFKLGVSYQLSTQLSAMAKSKKDAEKRETLAANVEAKSASNLADLRTVQKPQVKEVVRYATKYVRLPAVCNDAAVDRLRVLNRAFGATEGGGHPAAVDGKTGAVSGNSGGANPR